MYKTQDSYDEALLKEVGKIVEKGRVEKLETQVKSLKSDIEKSNVQKILTTSETSIKPGTCNNCRNNPAYIHEKRLKHLKHASGTELTNIRS